MKVVTCECGEIVRANEDDDLVRQVEGHISAKHPDLIGKLSREDILAMAEEV